MTLPKSNPFCVPPGEIEKFLNSFIQIFFGLFDTPNREALQQCYHDRCMFSLCITNLESGFLPIRQYRYGSLIHESRNLNKIVDDQRRTNLLRHGKATVMEFFRKKFPATTHDGNSFRVDVISSTVCLKERNILGSIDDDLFQGNRLIFTINGLFKEGSCQSHSRIGFLMRIF